MHKVLGVMGLPFQLMYAFTGALLCLASVALALFAGPLFGGDREAAGRSLWGEFPSEGARGRHAPMLELDELIARARVAVPDLRPDFVRIEAAGETTATISIWGERPSQLFGRGDVVLRATDGALLAETVTSPRTPAATVMRWVTGSCKREHDRDGSRSLVAT
jgi:hypothetical protein